MLKKLWNALGFWANPHRYLHYQSMLREAKWKMYVNEIRLLAKEMECPLVHDYCVKVMEKMHEMVE